MLCDFSHWISYRKWAPRGLTTFLEVRPTEINWKAGNSSLNYSTSSSSSLFFFFLFCSISRNLRKRWPKEPSLPKAPRKRHKVIVSVTEQHSLWRLFCRSSKSEANTVWALSFLCLWDAERLMNTYFQQLPQLPDSPGRRCHVCLPVYPEGTAKQERCPCPHWTWDSGGPPWHMVSISEQVNSPTPVFCSFFID